MKAKTDTIESHCLKCEKCDGDGQVNHWYAMDECKIITCPECAGKGVVWV